MPGRRVPQLGRMPSNAVFPEGLTGTGANVRSVLASWGVASVETIDCLRDEWDSLAWGRLAVRARPVVITDRCLLLSVPTMGDRQILRYNTAVLMRRVNERFGEDTVTSVRFTVERDPE